MSPRPTVLRPCAHPGCSALVERGRCEKHKRESWRDYERERRPPRDKVFYSSPAWRAARALVLAGEPLCRECAKAGRVVPAVQVDHVRAVKDGGAPFDPENLQPLCLACHSRKTLAESREAGKLAQQP